MGRQHVHFAMGVPTTSNTAATIRSKNLSKSEPKGENDIERKGKSVSAKGKDNDDDEDDDDGITFDTLNITAGVPSSSIKTPNFNSANTPEETVISGMRASANILIWVDVKRSAVEGGLQWWRSANGVVLTEGEGEGVVGLEWVRRVERRGSGEVVWKNGGG